ncbi:hypothetical protein MTBBW1_410010 [Desulfamplus magnetovallimortis]|uniref:Uncharacterized protein n=1 Tax=Desulfamplus magnetovallimortis TaxID=1246637 RepID=A0A1W1HGX3_9BACT|nr:hypothetical protein [Desulfamplus magnetovallimortis]SLM31655.1 hypothetical protein MTBBW1_410010 [Desulfamplus magnetovallimortis]
MKRDCNYIYSELVEGKNDVIGALAYSLYKQQKIECITDFEKKYERRPTEEELAPFKEISNSK